MEEQKNKWTRIAIINTILGFSILGLLIYKVIDIFGLYELYIMPSIYSLCFATDKLISSRKENNGIITYNAKEWPLLIGILIPLLYSFGLYQILSEKTVSEFDFASGLIIIVIFGFMPIAYTLLIFKDRKDFIVLGKEVLNYKDNNIIGNFEYKDISDVKVKNGINLTLKDGTICYIETRKMNLNTKDLIKIINDIEAKIPNIKIENQIIEEK